MKTPTHIAIVMIAACILAPAGCATSLSVHQDWDPHYDFSTIDSYAWLPLRATANIGEARLKRLVAAIDAEMAQKNLTLTADHPSVLFELHVMSERRLDLVQYGATARWKSEDEAAEDLDKGSMMLDILDGETRELVWRAVASSDVDPSASPEEQRERYAKLANKLFDKFPPPPK
jgi:hypothetical protein